MSNPFLRAYEFEKRYSLGRLRHTLEQAEGALKDFRPETIDFAKSALETICKTVLAEKEVATVNGKAVADLDFPPLVREALKALGCQDEKLRKHLGGLAESIAETRNRETVAGHGQDGDKAFIGKPGIRVFMATFSTILEAIMAQVEAHPPDLMTTRMTFDAAEEQLDLATFNEELDVTIPVTVGEEGDPNIYVGGREFRRSFLMYQYDRSAYLQALKAAREQWLESTIDSLKPIIVDGVMADFVRGGRGADEFQIKEVTIAQFTYRDNFVRAGGSIAASVDPDADGIFKRESFQEFSAEVDMTEGRDGMVLRSLTLKDVA